MTIATNNYRLVSSFPATFPGYVSRSYPEAQQPNTLYRVHRAIVDDTGPDLPTLLLAESESTPAAIAAESRGEEIARYKSSGMFYTSDGVVYWPTWIGAIRIAWSQLQPFEAIVRWHRARANARWRHLASM